ncbi:hypothetical protein [Microbacterium sp. bgisy189]|uniref:hypothetical protein n=1 Tax=Microbacterium sp. bgisy189 TaxID=3413798 RepID=UPI003EBF3EFB
MTSRRQRVGWSGLAIAIATVLGLVAGATPASALDGTTECQAYATKHPYETVVCASKEPRQTADIQPGGGLSDADNQTSTGGGGGGGDYANRSKSDKAQHCWDVRQLIKALQKELAAAEAAYPAAAALADETAKTAADLLAQLQQSRAETMLYRAESDAAIEAYLSRVPDAGTVERPEWAEEGGRVYVVHLDLNVEGAWVTWEAMATAREAQLRHLEVLEKWGSVAGPEAQAAQEALEQLSNTILNARALLPLLEADLKASGC